jgi:hypothetical protein
MKQKIFEYAGIVASVVLVVFGVGAVVAGISGRGTVRDSLALEQIAGSPDMTPGGIAVEAKSAGLKNVTLPTCSVADTPINTGARAKCFASYMRIHTLEATGGQVYADMPQYIGKDGKPTSDKTAAAVDPKSGKPVSNAARDIWINETALATALNTSFFAESVALFAIVMGIALLLTGIGLLMVSLRWLRERATTAPPVTAAAVPAKPVIA